jgi:hypothetical protein
LNGRPQLADRLALAIVEHGPSSGSRLAGRVAANKAAVLLELRTNPMFESTGRGRGSSWRLAGNRLRPPWEPIGTDSTADPYSDVILRIERLEQAVSELLAERDAAR